MHTPKYLFIIFSALIFLVPTGAFAAQISFQAIPAKVGVGDRVQVNVLLDSAVPTNAFSGVVSYSQATIEPVALSDGDSIVSLWITHPTLSTTDASISFVGITPGGFSGTKGKLFSIVFRAKSTGTARVSLRENEVLRNDGAGGKEPVTQNDLTFLVTAVPLGGYAEPVDTTPPEPFMAEQGSDPELFNGQKYLVFSAVDKDSGMDQYEVAETRVPGFLAWLAPLSWTNATSPYVLKDQNLTSTVYLKARDRSGNEQWSVYPPTHFLTVYEKVLVLAILTIVIFLLWRRWRKWLKKNL